MNVTELVLGVVGAAGSVATAYVIHVLGRVDRATNGYLMKLDARIVTLEQRLLEAQQRAGETPRLPADL